MNHTKRTLFKSALAALMGVALMHPAMAQDKPYPAKPITFIVPYSPGGPLDGVARLLAEHAGKTLKQTIIVENKPGAGGNIGASMVARARPDGYSIVMGAVATHAINPWLYKSLNYDPVKDFEPVLLVSEVPNVLVVSTAFSDKNNIKDVASLLDYAKKNPGKLNYASGGNGSAGHLAGELLKQRTGIDAVHVPYQGASPAKLSLLSDQTQFMFDNLASALPMVNDGKVRALALTTKATSDIMKNVPTMESAGIKDFDISTWFGIFATGGTPDDVVNTLHDAFATAMEDEAVKKQLLTMGSDTKPSSPEAFADKVKSEMAKYKEIVKISGATAQ